MGRQGFAVCNRVAFVQGTVTTQAADAAAARAGRGGSVRAPPTLNVVAGSAHVEKCAGVVARANKSGQVGAPTTQGVVAGSARATEGAGACVRATTGGRARAPTSKAIRGDKVTNTPKAEASSRDADSAAENRVPQVLDVFTGEPKVGEGLTPLPTVAELLELDELSYVQFLDSLPYHPLLKEFSDVVSHDTPSVLPPDRVVRHEFDLVPGTKYCTTRQWPLPKEQVDVIDAFFAAKWCVNQSRHTRLRRSVCANPTGSGAWCTLSTS
ncbi:unnamed protein product [Phytophthora fragariaefolia]|uniref:Unnamed protein product n=1 Tax=Phytophthora fragariaefolia TaxID=1490495 RepID=A0A9W6TN87_9STRA|nr:unnamed protein product [Phytophthora fragariaefolia]